MKRAIRRTGLVFLTAIMMLSCPPVWDALSASPDAAGPAAGAGYLENVAFEKLPGKERVILTASKLSAVTVENQPGNAVLVRLEDLFVPEGLRRALKDATLANVIQVTPTQRTAEGRAWVLAQIDLKQKVPYSVRQEGTNVLIEFNVTTVAAAATAPEAAPPSGETPAKAAVAEKVYGGPRIFLDVQDADIKAIFRLLSEQGNVSIVSGDDVKGTLTVHLKDVFWEQALDTILALKGLDKRQEGNIITVFTMEKRKKEEIERLAAEEAQRKTEDERKLREQKLSVEQGKLKQIAIEAKIVEVSTNFTQELGIRWGYGYRDTWGGRDLGFLIGNSPSGTLTTLPSGIGITNSNIAVNFPALAGALAPGIGIIAGSAKFVLDAKLSAMETAGDGRIISTPKVTTMDGINAYIKQGDEVPYTVRDKDGNPDTKFKEALLKLDVKPKITKEGNISMEILATNAYPNYEKVNPGEPPPIVTSEVKSTVSVQSGDTLVLGGVLKTLESDSVEGVPWLSKIPVLGWLFKYEIKKKETRELLVFITPRIITEGQ